MTELNYLQREFLVKVLEEKIYTIQGLQEVDPDRFADSIEHMMPSRFLGNLPDGTTLEEFTKQMHQIQIKNADEIIDNCKSIIKCLQQ